nr:MAG TPA: protein of unknown function (DUF5055) [Caudoviricetes sp.]
MAKQLTLTHQGKEYVLEFTRRTVKEMERRGFIASSIETTPMNSLPTLFAGAFLAHHKKTDEETINAIYKKMGNKEELIGKLADMYNDPIMSLLDEPEDDDPGKIDWTTNW